MLKITWGTTAEGRSALRVTGQIRGEWVAELERSASAPADGATPAVLDLTEVTYVDAEGLVALKQIVERGTPVVGASRFVTELLRSC